MEPAPHPRFPWWIVGGALLIAAGYLPTLATPFDFIDDGNLVYPAPPGLGVLLIRSQGFRGPVGPLHPWLRSVAAPRLQKPGGRCPPYRKAAALSSFPRSAWE